MKKLHLLLMSATLATLLFISLTMYYEQSTSKNTKLEGNIIIVLKAIGQPMDFWAIVQQGIKEASREFGAQVSVTGPMYEREVLDQIRIMRKVIKQNPRLIILAASDYNKLRKPVREAYEHGIPVITLDSAVNSDTPISFIATNNVEAGKKAGREMVHLLKNRKRKNIAIVSHIKGTATAIERERGIRAACRECNIIGTWYCNVEEKEAYRITKELIKYHNIDGIIALNEVSTLGVAQAVDELNAKERVTVVGFDNAPREMEYLEAGVIKATVIQNPYKMGYLAVKTAVEYLKGQAVPRLINTGSLLITKKNMFNREYQEIIFPFSQFD